MARPPLRPMGCIMHRDCLQNWHSVLLHVLWSATPAHDICMLLLCKLACGLERPSYTIDEAPIDSTALHIMYLLRTSSMSCPLFLDHKHCMLWKEKRSQLAIQGLVSADQHHLLRCFMKSAAFPLMESASRPFRVGATEESFQLARASVQDENFFDG